MAIFLRSVTTLFLLVGVLCVTVATPARADSRDKKSEVIIQKLADDVTSFLGEKKRTTPEIRKKFQTVLGQNFDLPRIGRFVLGVYWNQATDTQKNSYQTLFRQYVVHTYARRFEEYNANQKLEILASETQGNYSLVRSRISDPKNPNNYISIDWRLRKSDVGELRIVDVMIEGVSMSITQRDDFSALIDQNGGKVAALLDELKKRLAADKVAATKPS